MMELSNKNIRTFSINEFLVLSLNTNITKWFYIYTIKINNPILIPHLYIIHI